MAARRIAQGAVHERTARARQRRRGRSVHDADEVVDVVLAVAVLPALDVVQPLLVHAAARRAQLERPQEVGRLRSTPVFSTLGSVSHREHAAAVQHSWRCEMKQAQSAAACTPDSLTLICSNQRVNNEAACHLDQSIRQTH